MEKIWLLIAILSVSACKLTVTNEGGGIVTSDKGAINCGTQCEVDSSDFNGSASGASSIVLTATPDQGYEFTGWAGACSGQSTCTIGLTGTSGDKQVTATFTLKPITPEPVTKLLSIGRAHICTQGPSDLVCWGSNDYSQADIPAGISQVDAIYSGQKHNCIQTEAGLSCWGAGEEGATGYYDYGQSVVPETIQFPDRVALGWHHSCAIEEGSVQCWGYNEFGQTDVPAGLVNPREISGGAYHSCAIDDTGVVCWGAGATNEGKWPQLGQSIVPETIVNPSSIDIGDSRSCVVQDNEIICWGEDSTEDNEPPLFDGPIDAFVMGGAHYCALVNDAVTCWGNNYSGQRDVPAGLSNITHLMANLSNTCVIADEKLSCWGRNMDAQLFIPGSIARPTKIEAAENHICLLGEDGVHCWGSFTPDTTSLSNVTDLGVGNRQDCFIDDNGLMCAGDNNKLQTWVPDDIASSAVKVETGYDHNCAINHLAEVSCWGDDFYGESSPPVSLGPVSVLAVGKDASCALESDAATCWGDLASHPLSNPTALDIADTHGCAIDDNGVSCWGRDRNNKLDVPALTNPTDISVGYEHSCAVADEGVVCWGAGSEDVDSDLNYGQSIVPHDRLVNPRDVEAAYSYTCALDDIGVRCWGGSRSFKIIAP